MKINFKLVLSRARQTCGLLLLGGFSFAIPALAQLGANAPYLVVPLPSATALAGLSEPDANNNIYVAGSIYVAGAINAPKSFAGGAWTVTVPAQPLIRRFPPPGIEGPKPSLPQLPAATTVKFKAWTIQNAFPPGAALCTVAGAPSVRVGSSTLTLANNNPPLVYRPTCWVWNAAKTIYVAADMDAAGAYFQGEAFGVIARADQSLLAFGYVQTVVGNGLSPQQPAVWPLAAGVNVFGAPTVLAPVVAGTSAVTRAGSKRTDKVTVVGASGGTPTATYWQNAVAPVNLNSAPGVPASIQGTACGVTFFPDPVNKTQTDDLVVGVVETKAKGVKMHHAFAWFSSPNGGAPFSSVDIMVSAGVPVNNAFGNGVNGSLTVVGQARDATGRHGFLAMNTTPANPAAGAWTVQYIISDVNDPNTGTPKEWIITAVYAINDAGLLLGTAQEGQGAAPTPVLLIPNPNNRVAGAAAAPPGPG